MTYINLSIHKKMWKLHELFRIHKTHACPQTNHSIHKLHAVRKGGTNHVGHKFLHKIVTIRHEGCVGQHSHTHSNQIHQIIKWYDS